MYNAWSKEECQATNDQRLQALVNVKSTFTKVFYLLVFPQDIKIDYGVFFRNDVLQKKKVLLKSTIANRPYVGYGVEWFISEMGYATTEMVEEEDDHHSALFDD